MDALSWGGAFSSHAAYATNYRHAERVQSPRHGGAQWGVQPIRRDLYRSGRCISGRRIIMVGRSQSGAKQYEGTMDVPHGMRHCSVVDVSMERNEDKSQLLSVVVDDDESVRESLPDLLREFGFAARAFSSAKEFLSSGCVDETGCLILDIAMPDMSGPELQQELKHRGKDIPIIFITGRRDDTIRAQVLKQGAAGFLLKPFTDAALLAAIKTALQGTWSSTLDL